MYDAARGVASAWGGSFVALRRLLVADLALARVAMVRGLVLLFLAAIMFGTLWALLTALTVLALLKAGFGWGMALAMPLLVSAIIGVLAVLYAAKAMRMADLDASRRQLTLLFGTKEEVHEAKAAPPGTLHAGAPPAPVERHDPKMDTSP